MLLFVDTLSVFQHCNRVHRDAVEYSPLETFKTWQDNALAVLIYCWLKSYFQQEIRLSNLQRSSEVQSTLP